MNHASTRRAAIAAAAGLVLSACGNSAADKFLSRSPDDIVKTSLEAMREVESMRLLGIAETDSGMARFDMKINASSCVGSFDTADGGLQVIKNSDGAWFYADEQFWNSQSTTPTHAAEVRRIFSGSWVAIEGKNDWEELCDFDALLDGFKVDKVLEDNGDRIESDDIEQIGDTDAVPIEGRGGRKRATAWIDVAAPHHIVKMTLSNGSAQPDEFYLEEFGVEFVAETPDKEDIVTVPPPQS